MVNYHQHPPLVKDKDCRGIVHCLSKASLKQIMTGMPSIPFPHGSDLTVNIDAKLNAATVTQNPRDDHCVENNVF